MGGNSNFYLTSLDHVKNLCVRKEAFFLGIALLIMSPSVYAAGKKEAFFHNIYTKYYSEPTDNFDFILGESNVDKTYVIQRGDNLYDISSVLFGSPAFWPKIWSLNESFKNPHLIYEGRIIVFTDGDLETAPELAIKENSLDAVVSESKAVKIPKPSKQDLAPIELPESLPGFNIDIEAENEEFKAISSVDANKRKAYLDPLVFKVKSVISSKPPKSLGEVKAVFRGGQNATIGETVIIKSKEPLSINALLVAFNMPSKADPDLIPGISVSIVDYTGALRVDKNLGKNRYLAEVIESHDFVERGDSFFRGKIDEVQIARNDVPQALVTSKSVQVLGGESNLGRKVMGSGEIVYLDKGSNANIKINDLYLVYTDRRKKVAEPGIKYAKNIPISMAKIVDVEERVSTAILVDSVDEVGEGDYLNIRETSNVPEK